MEAGNVLISRPFSSQISNLKTTGFFATFVLLFTLLVLVNHSYGDKRGRVLGKRAPPITLDREGKPVVGGKFPLEARRTDKGIVLAFRHVTEDTAITEYFIAYEAKGDNAYTIRAETMLGENCYWHERGPAAGKIGATLQLYDSFYYSIDGRQPSKFALVGNDKLLAVAAPLDTKLTLIETRIIYDNLHDGK